MKQCFLAVELEALKIIAPRFPDDLRRGLHVMERRNPVKLSAQAPVLLESR